MKILNHIFILFFFFNLTFSDIKIYNHDQVFIINDKYFMNIKNKNKCGSNTNICKKYFDDTLSFLEDVRLGFLKKEKIYISILPTLNKKILSPYKYVISKNGYDYYLPKYLYNPNLLENDNIVEQHQISIGDRIMIYYLFDKVLFAEIINE